MELSFTEGALFVVLDPFKHIQAHSLCLGSDTRDAPLGLQYYGIFGRQSTLFKLLHVLLGSEVVKSSMRPHRVPCILPLLYLPFMAFQGPRCVISCEPAHSIDKDFRS